MFAFADPLEISRVLEAAGWAEANSADTHVALHVGGRGSVDDAVDFIRSGSMGRTLLTGVDSETASRALASLRAALAPHHDGDGVRLDVAVWLVTARA